MQYKIKHKFNQLYLMNRKIKVIIYNNENQNKNI